jgi:hypothetical protein
MATLGMSDNDDEPWSEMEIADLLSGLGFGASIEEIAAFLMRDPEAVRQKVKDVRGHDRTRRGALDQSRQKSLNRFGARAV